MRKAILRQIKLSKPTSQFSLLSYLRFTPALLVLIFGLAGAPRVKAAGAETTGEALPGLTRVFTVHAERFAFTGNKIFSDRELSRVVAAYEGRKITAGELEEVRRRITAHYISNGYIHSGAVIPDQKLTDGIILIKVEEGRLTGMTISGNRRLRTHYIQSRLERTAKPDEPVNYLEVLERLRLLKEDPRIDNIHARIKPGRRQGEAALQVEVQEARPCQLSVAGDNHRSPSVGAYQGIAGFTHNNITGWGDEIRLQYGITEGLNEYTAKYAVPLTRWDTTVSVYGERYASDIVTEPFDVLDVTSETDRIGGSIRQPVFRTPNRELTLELELQRSENEVKLMGVPFSFTPYEEGDLGIYRVTPLRFHQAYVDRGLKHVFAFRSTFSFGLDLWDATIDVDETLFGPDPPTADFFAWLGQGQFLLRLDRILNSQILARARVQLTPDSLLPSEQFGLGGYATVRGYRETLMTTDNGVCASLEWHLPLWRKPVKGRHGKPLDLTFHLVPFFDWGKGWNSGNTADPHPGSIYSAGIGLKADWGKRLSAACYWGRALRDVPEPADHNLQDDGIHLSVQMALF